nr:replication protein A 70 kDa DNA-binding subunit B [Tanacetum cinerariifolium]
MRKKDETSTMSLTLWNDEVQVVVDRSAYQLCDKYGKVEQNDQLPSEITFTASIGKKNGIVPSQLVVCHRKGTT